MGTLILSGEERKSLSSLREGMLQENDRVISFVGGGGKTSTMFALAEELAEAGFCVAVTTTTHIGEPRATGRIVRGWDVPKETLETLVQPGCAACVGNLKAYNGVIKMDPPPKETFDWLLETCDYVLIEADGSRRLPMKVPAYYEPVIHPATDLVVAVYGLSALGKPLGQVCQRVELAAPLLGKTPEDLVEPKDVAFVLSSVNGQRKAVEDRHYCAVLNQADDEAKQTEAAGIAKMLKERGVEHVLITAYNGRKHEKE